MDKHIFHFTMFIYQIFFRFCSYIMSFSYGNVRVNTYFYINNDITSMCTRKQLINRYNAANRLYSFLVFCCIFIINDLFQNNIKRVSCNLIANLNDDNKNAAKYKETVQAV